MRCAKAQCDTKRNGRFPKKSTTPIGRNKETGTWNLVVARPCFDHCFHIDNIFGWFKGKMRGEKSSRLILMET